MHKSKAILVDTKMEIYFKLLFTYDLLRGSVNTLQAMQYLLFAGYNIPAVIPLPLPIGVRNNNLRTSLAYDAKNRAAMQDSMVFQALFVEDWA